MTIKFTNNATTTLASGINSSATSLTVASGTGALFPSLSGSDVFYVTLANLTGTVEIVKVTARSSDTLTIVRAQDNTTAAAWLTGDKVELRPTAGILNTFVQQDPTAPSTFGFKNRIINGAMMIDQRNAGGSVSNLGGIFSYVVDRFAYYAAQASKFTIQQNAGSVTPPAGFTKYLGVTVGASANVTLGASDIYMLTQVLEGYNTADLNLGTASASPITLSFWVRSSVTGTFGGSAFSANTSTACYVFSYTINAANTWEYKTISIPACTIGTWQTTNSGSIQLNFSIGAGSSQLGATGSWAAANYFGATGQTNLITTNSATFYITGVQLEKGSTATSFDVRSVGTEVALCQRYFELFGNGGVGSSTPTASAQLASFKFSVPKRATPTVSHVGNYTLFVPNVGGYVATASAISTASTTGCALSVTVSPAPTATGLGMIYNTSTDNLSASAEL